MPSPTPGTDHPLTDPVHRTTADAAPPQVRTDVVADADRPLAAALHLRLKGSSAPVLITPTSTVPAASLWTAARALVGDLRALGLGPGDRVLVRTGDDLLVAAALVAGLTGGFTVALRRPSPAPGTPTGTGGSDADDLADLRATAEQVDARIVLCTPGEVRTTARDVPPTVPATLAGVHGTGGPVRAATARRRHDPAAAVLLHTSGTTGAHTWVALSQHNLMAVLDSHLRHLCGTRWAPHDPASRPWGVAVSVLPWTHAFGLVLDLLMGLLAAEVVVRDPRGAADPERLAGLFATAGPGCWFSAVPVTVQRLVQADPDRAAHLLGRVGGGVVGGARCDPTTAAVLAGTRMRAGYGLTEAGPGVTLGRPGDFGHDRVGAPVGCTVQLHDGVPVVEGPNVSLGVLGPQGVLVRRPVPRLAVTDVLTPSRQGWVFRGRAGDRVKLPNGTWVDLALLEREVHAGCGVPCVALGRADDSLMVVVGDDLAAAAVRRWAGSGRVGWYRYVTAVAVVPGPRWPRSPKGDVRRGDLVGLADGRLTSVPA